MLAKSMLTIGSVMETCRGGLTREKLDPKKAQQAGTMFRPVGIVVASTSRSLLLGGSFGGWCGSGFRGWLGSGFRLWRLGRWLGLG